jgi:hypothetical protein
MEVERMWLTPASEIDHREGAGIEALRAASQQPIPDPDAWLDEEIKRNVLFTTVDAALNWARKSSLWPVTASSPLLHFRVHRSFFIPFRYSPLRHGSSARVSKAGGPAGMRRNADLEDGPADKAPLRADG